MTTLVAGKVATVEDSMLMAKNKLLAMYQISKAHNSFYWPFTALLNLLK